MPAALRGRGGGSYELLPPLSQKVTRPRWVGEGSRPQPPGATGGAVPWRAGLGTEPRSARAARQGWGVAAGSGQGRLCWGRLAGAGPPAVAPLPGVYSAQTRRSRYLHQVCAWPRLKSPNGWLGGARSSGFPGAVPCDHCWGQDPGLLGPLVF